MEGLAYAVIHSLDLLEVSSCPCIVLAISGAQMMVNCVAFAGICFQMDPVISIPLICSPDDPEALERQAFVWAALKGSIKDLAKEYTQDPIPKPQFGCPYPNSFTDDKGLTCSFKYQNLLVERKNKIFAAKLEDTEVTNDLSIYLFFSNSF